MTAGRTLAVASLQEYIQTIKQEHLRDCITRGECSLFERLDAAAFRRNSHLDIPAMVDEFYSEIGNSLTQMQRQHFWAFSQHHGLPTNLLDFSHSPLVSLYFACSGVPDKAGYVYFIYKNRLVDITQQMQRPRPTLLLVLAQLACDSEDAWDLYDGINRVLGLNEEYGREMMECIQTTLLHNTVSRRIHQVAADILQKMRAAEDDFIITDLDKLIKVMEKILYPLDMRMEQKLHSPGSYVRLVRALLYGVSTARSSGTIKLPFYFAYEPPNIAARVSNQSSILISQLYGVSDIRQEIRPDCSLKVTNKAEILTDLDHLGINEKFIFNDYDHIASYVKQKHLRASDVSEQTFKKLNQMVEAHNKQVR